jgi:hypothetical protein
MAMNGSDLESFNPAYDYSEDEFDGFGDWLFYTHAIDSGNVMNYVRWKRSSDILDCRIMFEAHSTES